MAASEDGIDQGGVSIGPPKLTKYERARIVGARALQLSLGAMPLIDLSNLKEGLSFLEIAEEELNRGVLPITILRRTRSGKEEIIPAAKLLELEKRYYGLG